MTRKALFVLVLLLSTSLPSIISPEPASAAVQISYRKCVYWPAGIGNYSIAPYWKLRMYDNQIGTTWSSAYGYSTGHRDVWSTGWQTFLVGFAGPGYDGGMIWYASLPAGSPEPGYMRTWKPTLGDNYPWGGISQTSYSFSANELTCNYPNSGW